MHHWQECKRPKGLWTKSESKFVNPNVKTVCRGGVGKVIYLERIIDPTPHKLSGFVMWKNKHACRKSYIGEISTYEYKRDVRWNNTFSPTIQKKGHKFDLINATIIRK